MGVQSTIEITREDAEKKYVEMKLETRRKTYEQIAALLDDEALEDAIEEHFYNYLIAKRNK